MEVNEICSRCSHYYKDEGKLSNSCHFPFNVKLETLDLSKMDPPDCDPKDFFDALNKQNGGK